LAAAGMIAAPAAAILEITSRRASASTAVERRPLEA